MKKSELKDLINPIVRECVNENIQAILLESGLLSQVISEVVKGLKPTLTENRVVTQQRFQEQEVDEPEQDDEQEHMRQVLKRSQLKNVTQSNKQLLDNIGRSAYKGVNIFEGISNTIPDEPAPAGLGSALAGIAPDDSGVDISGLFDSRIAQALMKGKTR